MLANSPVAAMLPTTNLARARKFYEEQLGLQKIEISDPSGVFYKCGEGSYLGLYERPTPTKADHTAAVWLVADIEAAVDELTGRGIVFEQYDFPGLKTNARGIADLGFELTAWFVDSEGNILAISQIK